MREPDEKAAVMGRYAAGAIMVKTKGKHKKRHKKTLVTGMVTRVLSGGDTRI